MNTMYSDDNNDNYIPPDVLINSINEYNNAVTSMQATIQMLKDMREHEGYNTHNVVMSAERILGKWAALGITTLTAIKS